MPNMILFRKLYRSFAKGRKHKKEPPKQLFLAVSNNLPTYVLNRNLPLENLLEVISLRI